MIRKFGYDAVYKYAPVGGERKVLEGIRKKKERAKRKKSQSSGAAADEGDDEDEVSHRLRHLGFTLSLGVGIYTYETCADDPTQVPKTSAGNAFEDVLYNSDSESDSSGSEEERSARGKASTKIAKNGKKGQQAGYIRSVGDQPLDLLSRSIASGVTSKCLL